MKKMSEFRFTLLQNFKENAAQFIVYFFNTMALLLWITLSRYFHFVDALDNKALKHFFISVVLRTFNYMPFNCVLILLLFLLVLLLRYRAKSEKFAQKAAWLTVKSTQLVLSLITGFFSLVTAVTIFGFIKGNTRNVELMWSHASGPL